MKFFIQCILYLTVPSILSSNPFLIDYPTTFDPTYEDYLFVQRELRKIDIDEEYASLYQSNDKFFRNGKWQNVLSQPEMGGRIKRGIRQTLVGNGNGAESSFYKRLIKINKGSDNCIVCCVPIERKYPELMELIPKALEDAGFNGWVYYRVGGFPCPTGNELRYAGVPYCFKIFMMLEAQNLGFRNVLWIDSAMYPLRDPTPLFHTIKRNGHLLCKAYSDPMFIMPKTVEYIRDWLGINVLSVPFVRTFIFGLKMDAKNTQKIVKDYYEAVELGYPFFSAFPEEYVITSIMWKNIPNWKEHTINRLFYQGPLPEGRELKKRKAEGHYFCHVPH